MSTAADPSRPPGPRIGSGCSATVLLAGLVGLLTLVLGASPASAYWSPTGTGSAVGQTGGLAAPTVTVPANAVTDVMVSWTPGTGGVAPEGYYVTRQLGSTTVGACGTSPTALLTAGPCTDLGIPDGSYTYVVTAVYRSWTSLSAASSTVTVVNPTQLVFLVQPTTTSGSAAITPPVVVRLLSAAGNSVARAGISVTVSIGSNPSVGSLAGTTTVATAADGTATFSGLSIDRAGVGYSLVATSPGLTSATSAAFDVLPPQPLRRASSYSVLGETGVVNTLATTVSGDLGVGSGAVVTGFGPGLGTVAGDTYLPSDAAGALADAASAYAALRALVPETDHELTGNLDGLTLTPGVYHSAAALGVTGTVTLSGGPSDVFIIQVDAAFGTAAGDKVLLTGGASAANVYWVVDGAVTLGAGTSFQGTILAKGAITIGLATEVIGRAFATGAVTMANNTIRFTVEPPPTLVLTAQGAGSTKDVTPDISGTTNAPPGTAIRVTLAAVLGGPAVGQTLTTTVQAGGTWNVTAATLPADSYTVVAQVRDAAGNATKASQTVVVEVNPAPIVLGSAKTFSVLASGAVTNTLATSLSGDLGLTGGLGPVGFTPGMVAGVIHDRDAVAATAQTDLQTAVADGQGRTRHTEFAGPIGGRTFHVGVHHSDAAVGLTGTVTLDGENDANAVFIFQINGALTGAAGCQVSLINGAQAKNVFWVVNGAVGTGASCVFRGTILATMAITLGAGTNLEGQALSQAAVTLANNAVTGVNPAVGARFGRQASSDPTVEPTPAAGPTPTAEPAPTAGATLTTEPTPTDGATPTAQPTPTAGLTPSAARTARPSADPTPTPSPTASTVERDGAP